MPVSGRASSAGVPSPLRRRDLQGGRGIGVVTVVVGHLWLWPPGAFVALDMFFVLSGYLITDILVTYLDRYGARSLPLFYLRRARRLFPAQFAVVLITIATTFLLFSTARAKQVSIDGLWAVCFGANWHYIIEKHDYFASTDVSPFLHYWSLSLEEQFYLAWPALLLGLIVLAKSRGWSLRVTLTTGLGLVTAASFGYSVWHSAAAPLTAYYSTFDRIWALGAGALIATTAPWWAGIPRRLAVLGHWAGYLIMSATIFLAHQGIAYPAPWGLPIVLSTVLMIAGGVHHDLSRVSPLAIPPLVWLGDLSYSIYLAHLPILVLLPAFVPYLSPRYVVIALTLILVCGVLLFYLVEKPFRDVVWLKAPIERAFLTEIRPGFPALVQAGWSGVLALVTLAGVFVALHPANGSAATAAPSPTSDPHFAASSAGHARTVTRVPRTVLERRQATIAETLGARDFPVLDPPLGQLGFTQLLGELQRDGCASTSVNDPLACRSTPPGATRLAFVLGDSYAMAWGPGIRAALEPRGYAVQQVTMGECPAWTLPSYLHGDASPYPECATEHRLFEQLVARDHPDLIVLASASANVRNSQRPGFPSDPATMASQGLGRTLRSLDDSGARVVVLEPPPAHVALSSCVTRIGSPSACWSHPDDEWYAGVRGETAAAQAHHAAYIPTLDWFCSDNTCPGFVGTTPVTVDGSHLSLEYSRELAPLLRQALLGHAG